MRQENYQFDGESYFPWTPFLLIAGLTGFTFLSPVVDAVLAFGIAGGLTLITIGAHVYLNPVTTYGRYPTPDERDYYVNEMEGDDLIAEGCQYPYVGDRILTRISRVYSPEESEKIVVKVDLPDTNDSGEWAYEYPYDWDNEDENGFAFFAEEFGYDETSFTSLEEDPVLVKKNKRGGWVKLCNDPREYIPKLIEQGELSADDIQAEVVEQKYDIDLPQIATGEQIIVEDTPLKDRTVDDIR